MKLTVILLVAITSISTLGCRTTSHCIQPPEVHSKVDKKSLVDLAAKLEQLPVDANLKLEFTKLAETTYSQLNDSNAGFLLLARSIHCLMRDAKTPAQVEIVKSVTPELIQVAREMWAAKNNQKGGVGRLSLKERQIIEGYENGVALKAELLKYGIE